jgi:DNA replication protein DnaC
MAKDDDDDVLTRVRELLDRLEMHHAALLLDDLLPDKPAIRVAVLQTLERILRAEADRRLEKRIASRIRASRLPDHPTLETFDFEFQPTLDRAVVMDLATMGWVKRREDLVLIGQSGVGKSHIAKALCLIACSKDIRVQYTTCADLLSRLHASLADGSLREALKRYTLPTLLLIDDLGYDTIEQEHARDAQLLFKVLEARHGKLSTIVTSNLPAEKWAEYLGNQYLTVALLDRLLYHATAIVIEGPSYRLAHHRERQQALAKPIPDEPEPTTT